MYIYILSGKGEVQTLLSAFDAALKDCGMHNYNLIYLSSIIPPGSRVVRIDRFPTQREQYGHKAYVIKSEARSDKIGVTIGAGLGWYQFDEGGRGVFVEQHVQTGDEKNTKEVLQSIITKSIHDLCAFRDMPFDPTKMGSLLSITKVENKPACVLVLAVYELEAWT